MPTQNTATKLYLDYDKGHNFLHDRGSICDLGLSTQATRVILFQQLVT